MDAFLDGGFQDMMAPTGSDDEDEQEGEGEESSEGDEGLEGGCPVDNNNTTFCLLFVSVVQ